MTRLPHLAVAVLERVVRDPVTREGLVGDLEQRYARMSGRNGLARWAWLWLEVLSAAVVHAWDRWGRPGSVGGGGRNLMDDLAQDLRYAIRGLSKRPAFTFVVVATLAIGIGANTAMFSVVNAVMIRKYPYLDADRLVRIYTQDPGAQPWGSTAYADGADIKTVSDVFEDVALSENIITQVVVGDQAIRVIGESVSHNLYPMLGVEAALGRTFLAEEDETPGASPVLMLGYAFWQRAFSGDPGVIGRAVSLAGAPYTIVGVLPERYRSLATEGLIADIAVPIAMSGAIQGNTDPERFRSRAWRAYEARARLREGVSMEAAQARLDGFASQLRAADPTLPEGRSFHLLWDRDVILSPEQDGFLKSVAVLLLSAVGLLLLLACANLASFLLARGADRAREVGVRLALGAGRGRLVRQLLTETLLLAVLGGIVGLLVARWAVGLLVGFQPPLPVTFTLDVSVDRTVLLFTLGVSTAAGLLFGLAPALQSTALDLGCALKEEAGTGSKGRMRLRNGLIAFQMAVSVVLLVGGALFARSLGVARGIDPGFRTREAGFVWVDFGASAIRGAEREQLVQELASRAGALPGIEHVAVAGSLPLGLSAGTFTFRIPGVESPSDTEGHRVDVRSVDHGFFETMGIPLVSGRGIRESDDREAPQVVVVSEAMAARFWPGESPLGQQLFVGDDQTGWEVVGIARDTKVRRLGEPPTPLVYFPWAQWPSREVYFVATGAAEPASIAVALRRLVREVDPRVVIMEATTLEEHVGVMLFGPRMAALLLGAFGLLALALATVGLYGVVTFAVARRTREVGIRISLGADSRAVVGMVLGGVLSAVAMGGLVGLAVAIALAQLIRSFLYGVGPTDPVTIVGVPLLLAAVAAAAGFVPARRAARVNPADVLREE